MQFSMHNHSLTASCTCTLMCLAIELAIEWDNFGKLYNLLAT